MYAAWVHRPPPAVNKKRPPKFAICRGILLRSAYAGDIDGIAFVICKRRLWRGVRTLLRDLILRHEDGSYAVYGLGSNQKDDGGAFGESLDRGVRVRLRQGA